MQTPALAVDRARGTAVAGWYSLHNRDDLERMLGLGARHSSAEILLEGFERWGDRLPEHLVGEFSIVIWDGKHGQLLGFRDHLGVRPLCYHVTPGRIILACEPHQIIGIPDVDRSPDLAAIVDFCTWRMERRGSFFCDIKVLPPGHLLKYKVSSGEMELRRWFRPQPLDVVFRDEGEVVEEVRHVFRRAVEDRLDRDAPTVLRLSAGLDSSCIVGFANEIAHSRNDVRLLTASAVFPHALHDESNWIAEITAATGIKNHQWDGTAQSGLDLEDPAISSPLARVPTNLGTGDLDLCEEVGSSALLCGAWGDAVFGDNGILDDLIDRRAPLQLARYLLGSSPGERRKRLLRLWRYPQRKLRQKWHHPNVPPEILGPQVRRFWMAGGAGEDDPDWMEAFESTVQKRIWRAMTSSRMQLSLWYAGRATQMRGVELRFPLVDIRLVRLVASIPSWLRSQGARMRRWLQRRMIQPLLPPEIVFRASKPVFGAAVEDRVRQNKDLIAALLTRKPLYSSPCFRRDVVLQRFQAVLNSSGAGKAWRAAFEVFSVACVEAWLHGVSRYNRK